jgi:hypothetical protein
MVTRDRASGQGAQIATDLTGLAELIAHDSADRFAWVHLLDITARGDILRTEFSRM